MSVSTSYHPHLPFDVSELGEDERPVEGQLCNVEVIQSRGEDLQEERGGALDQRGETRTHAHTHAHTHARTRARTHACTHRHTRTHKHQHTDMHTHLT